jgi:hypothetical protein
MLCENNRLQDYQSVEDPIVSLLPNLRIDGSKKKRSLRRKKKSRSPSKRPKQRKKSPEVKPSIKGFALRPTMQQVRQRDQGSVDNILMYSLNKDLYKNNATFVASASVGTRVVPEEVAV